MNDFVYTPQRQYKGPAEWWYIVPDYTPTNLARAQEAYIRRFGVFPSTPRAYKTGKHILLAYPIPETPTVELPEPEEDRPRDSASFRKTALLPEQEPQPEEFDPAIEQLELLPMRELEALYMFSLAYEPAGRQVSEEE